MIRSSTGRVWQSGDVGVESRWSFEVKLVDRPYVPWLRNAGRAKQNRSVRARGEGRSTVAWDLAFRIASRSQWMVVKK
jgi:hypothetical protein